MIKKEPSYLIIGEAFYPEEFIINDLVQEWEKEGYKLEVLTRSPSYPYGKVYKGYKNKLYQKEKWGSVLIHRFPVIPGYNRSKLLKILNYLGFVLFGSFIGLFLGKRYTKIFIYHTGPLSLAIPGILIKKLYKIPVTIWSFDLWPSTVYAYGFKKTKILSWFLNNLVRWIYSNCENIIVSSQGFVPTVQKYAVNKTIHVASNWPQTLNVKSIKSSIVLAPNVYQFTFTGNVGKVQNMENVILGFHRASLGKAQLNIIGDGSNLEYLKQFVASEHIVNVIFHGRIPVNEINNVLEQSNVLLISLIPDPVMELTVPLKFQTYLLSSKPIFAIMLGEVNRIVTDYKLGNVAHPLKIEEITKGFRDLIVDPFDLEEVKAHSEYLINHVYNQKKTVDFLTSIFFKE